MHDRAHRPSRPSRWTPAARAVLLGLAASCASERRPAPDVRPCGGSPLGAIARDAPPTDATARASVAHDTVQPDPSVFVDVAAPDGFRERPEQAARLGAARLFESPTGRVVLSFVPREQADADDLAAFAAAQDALFTDVVGPRDLRPLALPSAADPFAAAGLPSVTRAYLNRADSARDAICDAAAVRWETPGGFWTLSWNAPVGDLASAAGPLAALLAATTITRR